MRGFIIICLRMFSGVISSGQSKRNVLNGFINVSKSRKSRFLSREGGPFNLGTKIFKGV